MMVFERVKKSLEQSQPSDHSANKHERAYEQNHTIKDRFNQVDHESNLFPPLGSEYVTLHKDDKRRSLSKSFGRL